MIDDSTPTRTVFLFAFACEPGRGSEPGVGYSFAEALTRLSTGGDHKVFVVTRPHTAPLVRDAIDAAVGQNSMTIIPIRIPMWLVAITKRTRVRLAYLVWQAAAVLHVRRLARKLPGPFVAHHVTFATEALPTFENLLGRNARIVFGPSGSSQDLNLATSTGVKARLRGAVRGFFGRINLRGVRVAVANNDSAGAEYSRLGAEQVIVEPNIALSADMVAAALSAQPNTFAPHSMICVSLLIERKRIHLAIEALALLPGERLLIVGNGPLESELKALAHKLGVDDRVTFAGKQTREATLALIAQSRVLIHPSRQEGSGGVIGEAQTLGTTPVVISGSGAETAVKLGGSGEISGDTPESLADAAREALTKPATASDRWGEVRIPGMLAGWYAAALDS